MDNSEYLLFLHIPKTGGTTLQKILERQYGVHRVLRLEPPEYKLPLAAEISGLGRPIKVVMGHFAFGAHEVMGVAASYITVIRNPVDRVVSQYLFSKDRVTHPHYRRMRGMTLKDYVLSDVGAEINNGQTKLIAGGGTQKAGIPIRPELTDEMAMLDRAIENIENSFAVLGVLEDFDRSLIVMKMKLGWSFPYYTRVNVTRARSKREILDDETLTLVRDYNAIDVQLCEYVRNRLAEQWRALGPVADKNLNRFRRVNQPLQVLGTPPRELARRVKWWVYWLPRWRWQQHRGRVRRLDSSTEPP